MFDFSNIPVFPALLAAGAACARAAWMAHRRPRLCGPREPRLWATFAALFLALAAAKCLGIVESLGNAARDEMRSEGMYDNRRVIQVAVVFAAAIFCAAQSAWYARHISQRWKRYRWTLIGLLVIISFGIIRAVSLHELDALGSWMTVAKVLIEGVASVVAAVPAWRRAQELKGAPPARHHRRHASPAAEVR